MRQTKNANTRKKRSPGPLILLLLVLICVVLCVILIPHPKEKPDPGMSSSVDERDTEVRESIESEEANVTASPSPSPAPEPGTLLESGTDINENYYKKLDYTGTPSDLTGSSFVLGKERPATIGKTGQDYSGTLTVHFGDDTVVKTARLLYADDKYEIYMGTIDDLKIAPGTTFDVILEDPEASELRAREIIVSTFVF